MSKTNNERPDANIQEDLQTLTSFLNLDHSRIKSVIDAFNKNGANVSYNTIAELTGLDLEESIEIRDAFACLVHFYIDHNKLFEEGLTISVIDKQIVKEVRLWIKKLTKKGLKGLCTLYFALITEGSPSLGGIDYNLMLGEILDEAGEPVGHLPLLRLELDLFNGNGGKSAQTIFISLENFNGLIKKLEDFQGKAVESARNYRKKLGDSVILVGDE